MKYYVTDYKNSSEKEELKNKGLFCYDLRSGDDGEIIATIEKRVIVNCVGSIVTNEELSFNDKSNAYIDYGDFASKNKMVSSIYELFNEKITKTKKHERNDR